MEWLRTDRLLQEHDMGVLEFQPTSSTILTSRCNVRSHYKLERFWKRYKLTLLQSKTPIKSQTLESDEQWEQWLDDAEARQGNTSPDGITLLCCGRAQPRYPGMEVAYLPFTRAICQRVVPIFQIHGSTARVINRSSRAQFMALHVKGSDTTGPLLLYNCRSCGDWENDLVLSVTYSPQSRTAKAVLYGCDDATRNTFYGRLSLHEGSVCHPLTLPTIFADVERGRLFDKVDPLVTKLVNKALNISSAAGSLTVGSPRTMADGGDARRQDQREAPNESPEELMKLWLSVSRLKRGLETWKTQLQKMLSHCQTLTFAKPPGPLPAYKSSPSPTVDVFDTRNEQRELDEIADLIESAGRIEQRLVELIGEYDEKIRECAMIIDGMVLATQLEWNNIGQADAKTNVEISRHNLGIASSTHNDSRQMRSIAVLTMFFLPATFVATLFSMGFFNWSPGKGQAMLSPYIWVYFVITAGSTGVTFSAWYLYTKRKVQDEEM